jgi:RHS repeat-associated protein
MGAPTGFGLGRSGRYMFNRVTDQRWQNNITATPTDIDRYQYGYDQNSNRTYKGNVVGTPVVTGGLDEYYSYDNLNRLTEMQRGVLNSGKTAITGTPAREMDYTLDPTGNWSAYLTKTNGTTDLNQTRTANKVNEITAIGGTPAWATPPAYDLAGNMTSFPRPAAPSSNFTATYDAWNRLVTISSGGSSVATYQYDGRGRRIVKVTAATSETRHFYYTNNWQNIEERTGTSAAMDKQYVWGARYIDELVCRDDTSQRLYAMQDANFNLTSIANASGGVVERYLFDPYGNRTIMNASWGTISTSAYSWAIGHQGLIQDAESCLLYNRNRMIHILVGVFSQSDPIRYENGMSLVGYLDANPIDRTDPQGLSWGDCFGSPRQKNGQVCGYSIMLLTGHCCADPEVVLGGVQGYKDFMDCWWTCEKQVHTSACGIALDAAEVTSIPVGAGSVRLMKNAAELVDPKDPYTTVARTIGRRLGGESSGAADIGKMVGRSRVSIGAKVGVVAFVYVEAGISWACSAHCS